MTKPVVVKERSYKVWVCPHCQTEGIDDGPHLYRDDSGTWFHRGCSEPIQLPEGREVMRDVLAEAAPKRCKCKGSAPCACGPYWAFAPFYGDGKGHSGATIPHDNVIPNSGAEAPSSSHAANPGAGGINSGDVPDGPNSGMGPSAPAGGAAETGEPTDNVYEGDDVYIDDDLDIINRMFFAPATNVPVEDPGQDAAGDPMMNSMAIFDMPIVGDDEGDPMAPPQNPVSTLPQVSVPVGAVTDPLEGATFDGMDLEDPDADLTDDPMAALNDLFDLGDGDGDDSLADLGLAFLALANLMGV